uniref:Uncharacterized protein n=1 Tax=Arundo donax TaxID=35708 RepID=A0A0A9BEB7_ARUDO
MLSSYHYIVAELKAAS